MSIELIIGLGVPLVLVIIGKIVGSTIERRHFESIAEREARFSNQPAFTTKQFAEPAPIRSAELASGSVVVSVDHFKRFVSGFRMLLGGEVRSYATLIDRARREAVLRMKESRPDADAYINTRLETSTISSTSGDEGMGTIEVLAYGTAVHYDRAP
ncbi:MAG: heavy metal-binding domain-containing protein [Myxococcales bacterium]|nr:MAG: heavy metal-binding domain-containing protein [Myxococcales bacterium]